MNEKNGQNCTIKKYEQNERVNCGFMPYGVDHDTGLGHVNHAKWI